MAKQDKTVDGEQGQGVSSADGIKPVKFKTFSGAVAPDGETK